MADTQERENTEPRPRGLGSRGIGGQRALNCCEKARNGLELDLRATLGKMLEYAIDPPSDSEALAFVAPVLVPREPLIRIPTGPQVAPRTVPLTGPALQALGVGAVVFLGASYISTLEARLAAIETLTAVLRAVDTVIRSARDTWSCRECVEKNLWSQSAPRDRVKTEEGTIYRRKPGGVKP